MVSIRGKKKDFFFLTPQALVGAFLLVCLLKGTIQFYQLLCKKIISLMVLSSETLERSRVELYHLHLGYRKAAFPDNQVRSKYKLLVLFARYKIWMIACVLVCAYPAAEHLLFQGP